MAVRAQRATDVQAIKQWTESAQAWAKYLNLTGEKDSVDASPTTFKGQYDWRAYIAEEAEIARRREESKPAPKKTDRAVDPAPTVFYA